MKNGTMLRPTRYEGTYGRYTDTDGMLTIQRPKDKKDNPPGITIMGEMLPSLISEMVEAADDFYPNIKDKIIGKLLEGVPK